MTRKEAINLLKATNKMMYSSDGTPISDVCEALDMAIEALQEEPNKAVPPSLADVYKWERDIALSQLEEYGIGFAEKKRDDLVEVVRCKDCKWYGHVGCAIRIVDDSDKPKDNDYCSFGERKGGDDE